ncbi:VOC family protein [Saccharopolyspora mangrovi]|uniref:VOC family protein n=1 Tax=Saccharopolyspora mangrovi TaxID=3082379 RepID=A0ABU6A422_9PSEU|nr:VOC family protein [Saccharopolyspora sp. S2-29]MEB3366215.1 VOC family protein [Saccharopolyspora sp. S2-29]
MPTQISTFLMFQNSKAEEAMNFYISLFDDAEVLAISRYGPGEQGVEGSVQHATFTLCERQYMCIDSPVSHGFDFTPSVSLYVDCVDEAQQDRLHQALSEDGGVLMPPGDYGFSRKFSWVNDRYGVSWQLNLPHS